MQDETQIANPIDIKQIYIMAFLILIALSLALFEWISNGKLFVIQLMVFLALVVLISYGYREIYHRPSTVILNSQGGFSFCFVLGRKRRFKWSDVVWIDALPGTRSKDKRDFSRDGQVRVGKYRPFPLTYEAAEALRQAYCLGTGNYPITRDEFRRGRR